MGKRFIESKTINIVLAILIACLLWFYVTSIVSDEQSITVRNIPVTIVGEDVLNAKGLMIEPGSKLTVNVELKGGRANLVNIVAAPTEYIVARIDVSDIGEVGAHTLTCRVSLENAVTTGIRLSGDNTKKVEVSITKLMTKNLEIRGEFTGTVADGYRTSSVEVSPGTMWVQGPEAVVSQIQYAQVAIGGEQLTKTVSAETPISFVGEGGTVIDRSQLTASVENASVVLPVVKMLELPLTVEFAYGGGVTEDNFERYVTYSIEPAFIQISGDEADIKSLEGNSLTLGTVNLSDVVKSAQIYTFPIVLSTELSNDSGITEATVSVSVKELEMKTVETTNIDIINVPDGFSATAVTQSLQVRVRGPVELLEAVSGYQIRVVVDLEHQKLTKGQFFFTARVYFDGDNACGVVKGANDSGYGVVVNVQQ